MKIEVIKDQLFALALLGACVLAATLPAGAATVTVPNGGSLFLSETTTAGGSSPLGNTSAPDVPGNYFYHDSWTAPQSTPVAGTTSGFYDDFIFTIGAGQVDSVTSSISLSNFSAISGMQVRLYDYNANGQVAPLLTPAVPGSAFDAWSTAVAFPGGTSTVDVLSPVTLAAGTYVVEVRGTVSGSAGGNYTGSLNLAPVPLPAAFPLLLSGLGLMGRFARRRAVK